LTSFCEFKFFVVPLRIFKKQPNIFFRRSHQKLCRKKTQKMARIAFVFFIGIILIPLSCSYNLPPFLLNDGESHELLPIPLPWKNEQVAREIDLNILLRTTATNGGIFTIQSHEPDQFEYHLALRNSQLHLLVRVNKKIISESIDDSIIQDLPTNISLIINFDKMEVILNGHKMHYYDEHLERREDSMIISIGSSSILNTCVYIQEVSISGEIVKLEASKPDYAVCDPQQSLIVAVGGDENDILPPRGNTADDNRGEVEHNQQPNEQGNKAGSNDENDDGEPLSGGESVLNRQKEIGEEKDDDESPKNVVPVVEQMPGADFNDIEEAGKNKGAAVLPKDEANNSDQQPEAKEDQEAGDDGGNNNDDGGDNNNDNDDGEEAKVEEANIGVANQKNSAPNLPSQNNDDETQKAENTMTFLAKQPEIGEGAKPAENNNEENSVRLLF
jgi:hypothetical protein